MNFNALVGALTRAIWLNTAIASDALPAISGSHPLASNWRTTWLCASRHGTWKPRAYRAGYSHL